MGFRPLDASHKGRAINERCRAYIRTSNSSEYLNTYIRLSPCACRTLGMTEGQVNSLVLLWDPETYRLGMLHAKGTGWDGKVRNLIFRYGAGFRTSIGPLIHELKISPDEISGDYEIEYDEEERLHYISLAHLLRSQRIRDRFRTIRGAAS